MLLQGVAIDHDVIEIHHHKLIKEWIEYAVHEDTECSQRVGEVERHDFELVRPISRAIKETTIPKVMIKGCRHML